jgi:hypothetical protein
MGHVVILFYRHCTKPWDVLSLFGPAVPVNNPKVDLTVPKNPRSFDGGI